MFNRFFSFYLSQLNDIKYVGIAVKIYRDGKLLYPLQLEREYQDWILSMHERYDEETDHGEDQPIVVVSPANKKAIHISSDGRYKRINSMTF